MGASDVIHPDSVKPMPGNMVVEIVEILGGETKGGLFIPGHLMDHMGKDTFYGRIIRVGDPPRLEHYKTGRGWDVRHNSSGATWPKEMMDIFTEGDIVVLPRDVPLAFVHEETRYAIVHIHEAILHIKADSFDPQSFEFVPWKPNPVEDQTVVHEF